MARLMTLSFHGSQCENPSQQDVHLTEACFSGDMFFTQLRGSNCPVKDYASDSAAPDRFCVSNAVLDNHFHSSKTQTAVFI
ncbi:hypothetical protein [Pantoea ananatis]|uniref:hypothetical protein n=1 Tax=Pantoea ananas TaxID=553 RepID=UPI000495D5F5|nr:hypothetical protein [Pantoea ananatis]